MYWLVKKCSLIVLLVAVTQCSFAQQWFQAPDTVVPWRAAACIGGQSALYVSTLAALQLAWYSEYQSGSFHFFNDWPGWMQMDKLGHATSAYQSSTIVHQVNRWAGISERRSVWYSTALGWSYLLTVEVMDGFSEGWGFSGYDLLFNSAGSALFAAQQLAWKSQPIKLKFSFSPSGLDQTNAIGTNYREVARAEELYGTGLHEQWLKDYNGQTYWVSANLWSLAGKPEKLPKWLNIAIGYSANNLLGAESNTWQILDASGNVSELYSAPLVPERQFLLSLDVDLDHVRLPRYLAWIKPVFGVVKVPFPALEWNSERGLIARPFYF